MKTVYGACLRYLTYIPLDTACDWGKGFHILWLPRERSTHIMFCAWDYYLDDLCSVITLHVTVQRCSPNINSPMLPPHGCERTVKYNWVSRSPYQLFSVGLLTIICNEGKGKTPATAHRLFSCELWSNWFCSWFYCFQTGWIGFYKYMNIKSEKAEILFTNRPLDESISWLPYPKTKITLFVCRFFNHFY